METLKKQLVTSERFERTRRIFVASIGAMLAKAVGVATSIASVPIALNTLGEERYGLWVAIASILGIFSLADFGIGNNLIKAIASSKTDADNEKLAKSVPNVLVALMGIAGVLALAGTAFACNINWAQLFPAASAEVISDASSSFIAAFTISMASLPFSVFQKIQLGRQQAHLASVANAIGSILSLSLLATAASIGLPMWVLAGCLACQPLVAHVCSMLLLILGGERLKIDKTLFDHFEVCRQLLGGSPYFVLQIIAIGAGALDNLIIARYVGLAEVATYGILQRIFISFFLAQYFVHGLLAGFGSALTSGDLAWCRQLIVKSVIVLTAISLIVSTCLSLFSAPLLEFWLKREASIPIGLLAGFTMWTIYSSITGVVSTFLNAANKIWVQVLTLSLSTASAAWIKIFFAPQFGAAAVIWSGVVVGLLAYTLPLCLVAADILKSNQTKG